MREKWRKLVAMERCDKFWKPNKSSVICSNHFLESDVYWTDKGYKRLKKTAVPQIEISTCTVRRRLTEAEEMKDEKSRNPALIKKRNPSSLQKLVGQTVASKRADGVESKDETNKDADNACHGCEKPFSGFVYECIQCDYRMCAECDEAGLHKDHYVLRVPAHCSKSEVEMVMARVRSALQDVKLEPPPGEDDQRVPGDSDDEPEPDLEPTVEVKMEAEIDEYDPLQSVTKAEVPVEVKTEPPDADETAGPVPVTCVRVGNVSRTTPDASYVDLNTSIHMKMAPSTIKIEPPDEEPSTSQFVPTISTQRQFAGKRPPGGEGPEGGTKEAKQKRQKKKVT